MAPPADGGHGRDGDAPPPDVHVPIEDAIDLHTFRPRDVPAVVLSYLDEALAAGFREVRIVHGRGIGVQRDAVRRVLARHPAVTAFGDAPPERGGWGATVVVLAGPTAPARGRRGAD